MYLHRETLFGLLHVLKMNDKAAHLMGGMHYFGMNDSLK